MKGFLINGRDGYELLVMQVGKSVVLEMPLLAGETDYSQRIIQLSDRDFKKFASKLKELAEITWPNIEPKEANSYASDYYQYYDRELDNNGYFSIDPIKGQIKVEQVCQHNSRVFKFNKRRMQSLLFDLEKEVAE